MQNGVNFIKGINSQISIHQESNKNRIKEDLDKDLPLYPNFFSTRDQHLENIVK